MKKLVCALLLMASAATAGLHAGDVTGSYIIRITDVTEDMIGAFLSGEVHNAIVELPENTYIPFKYFLRGNLINLVPEERAPIYIKIMRTFYLKVDEQDFLLSTDLQNWKPLFEAISGDVSLSIETSNGHPTFCAETTLQVEE
jgi:hypothetical protein